MAVNVKQKNTRRQDAHIYTHADTQPEQEKEEQAEEEEEEKDAKYRKELAKETFSKDFFVLKVASS